MRKNQKYSKGQMYALISKCEQGPLSQEQFIGQHGIAKSTFGYWRRKYLREAGQSQAPDGFIPVKVGQGPSPNTETIEVAYPNGVRLVCPPGMDLSRLKPLIVL